MKLKLLILLIMMPALSFGKPKGKSLKQIIIYNSPMIGEGFPRKLIITPTSLKSAIVEEMDGKHFTLKFHLKISENNYKLIDSVISIYRHSNVSNQGGAMEFLYKIETTNGDTRASTFTLNAQYTRVLLTTLIATVHNHKGSQKIKEIFESELYHVID